VDTGSKSQKDQTVHTADKNNIITDPAKADSPERRDQYLKRIKLENEQGKKALERVDRWIEIEGKKVMIKSKNRAGSVYSQYFFNGKRYENELNQLKTQGFWPMPSTEEGKPASKLELRYVNGRPFKKGQREQ